MQLSNIIALAFIPMGLIALYRPALLLYLFLTVPVLEYVPHAVVDLRSLELLKFGSISLYVWDYLIFIMAIVFLKAYFLNPRLLLSVLKSPIAKVVIFVFIWEGFIAILSYSKGFGLSNILRRLSLDSLMFIAVLIPLTDMTDIKKKEYSILELSWECF
jgi:hypothetical protein